MPSRLRAAGEANMTCRSASMMVTPSLLDSTRSWKSSSLRTRSSVSLPSSRIRSTSRSAMRKKTTAQPISAPIGSGRPCHRLSVMATGRPSMPATTITMPSGLTRGEAARAPRSVFTRGAW